MLSGDVYFGNRFKQIRRQALEICHGCLKGRIVDRIAQEQLSTFFPVAIGGNTFNLRF